MKKVLSIVLALTLVMALAACGNTDAPESTDGFSAVMVTDVGGVNDQSFNQSAWEGLQSLEADGITVKFLESVDESDYTPNMDKFADEEHDIIWGVGYMLADAIVDAAARNPDQLFAIVDNEYENVPSNVICAVFKAEEPSFLVGYIAAKMTETNKVGFVGGMESDTIKAFEVGFRAGVAYGAEELGKTIEVEVQYADSFSDAAIGKAIAMRQNEAGCDIIFHAAGGAGNGVIEAAAENNFYAIGVDRDQNYLAEDFVITSAMKKVGEAMASVTTRVKNGEDLGGQTLVFGLAEGAVGLAPTSDKLVPASILADAQSLEQIIIGGGFVVPATEDEYDAFVAGVADLPKVEAAADTNDETPVDGDANVEIDGDEAGTPENDDALVDEGAEVEGADAPVDGDEAEGEGDEEEAA